MADPGIRVRVAPRGRWRQWLLVAQIVGGKSRKGCGEHFGRGPGELQALLCDDHCVGLNEPVAIND
jgi:hypothetical protein